MTLLRFLISLLRSPLAPSPPCPRSPCSPPSPAALPRGGLPALSPCSASRTWKNHKTAPLPMEISPHSSRVLTSICSTHPPGAPPRAPLAPRHAQQRAWRSPCTDSEPGAGLLRSLRGHPSPGGSVTCPPPFLPPLGRVPALGSPPQHPPACCAWMSLLCTASADSISVRLVWIIWGQEGQREVLSTPPAPHIPPHAPCLRSKWGEKRGWEGVGWGSPWHGAARCGAASAWRAARSPCNTKEGSGSGLRLLMGFLPPWAAPQDAPRARWGLWGPRSVGSLGASPSGSPPALRWIQ